MDGVAIDLDEQGRARFTPPAPGRYTVVATATDADGLVGTTTSVIKVRDPLDQAAPVVALDPNLGLAPLADPVDLIGTVSDTNLDEWVLTLVDGDQVDGLGPGR